MLPKIAEGDANKLSIIPSEIGDALKGLSGAVGNFGGGTPASTPAATAAMGAMEATAETRATAATEEVPAWSTPVAPSSNAAKNPGLLTRHHLRA
ncbi:hypothetical protein SGRIM128S_08570 [Streptomyces griseomycini]